MSSETKETENKREFRINAIGEILDTDAFILEHCDYSEEELSGLFNKAVRYHDSLAEANAELQDLVITRVETWPGEYSRDVTTEGFTAKAMKVTQRMTHIENRINRLAESVRLRAQLKHKAP